MKSGPVTYKVRVGDPVRNKHMEHLKAVTSPTGQEQNIPDPSERTEGLGRNHRFMVGVVNLHQYNQEIRIPSVQGTDSELAGPQLMYCAQVNK
eukprot:g44481.t1